MCSDTFLQNSIKLLMRSFPVMLRTFFCSKSTQRAFQGHTKGTQIALEALGHSSTWSTRLLEGHLSTQTLKAPSTWALRYFGTGVLEEHLGTQEYRHSCTWVLETIEALYLADSYSRDIFHKNLRNTKHLSWKVL